MARGVRTIKVILAGDSKSLEKALGDGTGALGRFEKDSGSVFGKVGKFAAAGMAAVGTAVAGAAVASIKSFADFDAKMTESLAIMGDVSDEMRTKMSDAAREVGRTTKFGASEAAEAFYFLASAGLDAEQQIAALPQVAAFAQAGMFDLARATDLATDAQSALGLSSDDAEENLAGLRRVTDVMVKANTLANASVEQFSEALTNKAGASLRVLNKDMEEGVAVLAAYADRGVKGAAAGEGLSILLRDVTRAAASNKEEFAKLGIEVFDQEGNMRNLADVVGSLEDAFGDLSDEQLATTLQDLGLTRSVADQIRLLSGASDEIREYEAELRNAGGTTEEVASKQMETFTAQLGLLKDQLIDVGIGIGETLMPYLMSFVEYLQDNMPHITRIIDAFVEGMGALFGVSREDGSELNQTMDGWHASFQTTGEAVDTFASGLERFADFMEDRFIPAMRSVKEWWDRTIGAIGEAAAGYFGFIDRIVTHVQTTPVNPFGPNARGVTTGSAAAELHDGVGRGSRDRNVQYQYGPITVQASDPDEMGRKLDEASRTRALMGVQ
jgi:TP901 family phage tail tape measure protein